MENKERSEEIIIIDNEGSDGLIDDLDSDIETSDEGDNDSQQNGASKPASNFKKLSKALKDTRRQMLEKDANISDLTERLNRLETLLTNENEDMEEQNSNTGVDNTLNLMEFVMDNPEAKQYKNDIKETLSKFPQMTMEEAYRYVKASQPERSVSKNDYDLRNTQIPKRKRLEDLTEDEAYDSNITTKAQLLQWLRTHKRNR